MLQQLTVPGLDPPEHNFPAQIAASWSSHRKTCLTSHSCPFLNFLLQREVFSQHQTDPEMNIQLRKSYLITMATTMLSGGIP